MLSVNGNSSACGKEGMCVFLRPGVATIEAHPEFIVCLH